MTSHSGANDTFAPWPRDSPALSAVGGVRVCSEDPLRAGFEVTEPKVNSRGFLHAGVVSTIGDVVIGHTLTRLTGDRYVTIELSGRYLARAQLGEWVDIIIAATKTGGRLAAGSAEFTVGGRFVASVNGMFLPQVVARPA